MEDTNPYSYSPHTFVDLLNSQNDSNTSHNIAQTSQHIQFSTPFPSQPVHFSSPFSSQPGDPEDCIELTLDENEEEGGRGSRIRWSTKEDVNLISAWLNTSKDPVRGNEQRVDCFWKRVADYFQASEGESNKNSRGPKQCKARWSKINHQVNKFVGCYTQATARRKSGESEDDVMSMANELYKNDLKKPFTLGHCWRELKHDQKWKVDESIHKKSKLAAEGSSSTNDGDEMRPPGVKASKKKRKKPIVSIDVEDGSLVKLDRIIAMKDKEQAAKDRHGKMRLLDSLINKGELTPAEVILREKLVVLFSSEGCL